MKILDVALIVVRIELGLSVGRLMFKLFGMI